MALPRDVLSVRKLGIFNSNLNPENCDNQNVGDIKYVLV
jgi:hypothetical protein